MVLPTVTVPLALLLKDPKVQSIQKKGCITKLCKRQLYRQTAPLVPLIKTTICSIHGSVHVFDKGWDSVSNIMTKSAHLHMVKIADKIHNLL